MNKAALRLVDRPSLFREEGEFWGEESTQSSHSLHYVVNLPGSPSPEFAAFALQKFSRRGDVVVDPFCGDGAVALEAALSGRVPMASDIHELAPRITSAKLFPSDITEVTLRLQCVNLKRPVAVELYRSGFQPFYSLETFRELIALRLALSEKSDRVSRFIELLTLGLLHGHSAGYFSVYSLPQVSVTPDEQELLNAKRGQVPDYRAVVPRLLRRCAMAVSDSVPSILKQAMVHGKITTANPANLSHVASGSANVAITSLPLPGVANDFSRLWLKAWFAEVDLEEAQQQLNWSDLETWLGFMNEVLLEMARTVRSGGRAVLHLGTPPAKAGSIDCTQELMSLVEREFGRYWDAESLLIHRSTQRTTRNVIRNPGAAAQPSAQVLVLRRR